MVFCIAADEEVKNAGALPECDFALFGFNGLGEVDYEKELKGETEKFEEVARLSKKAGCGILCGCKTVSRGIKRKSLAAASSGRLLGISDMNHVFDGDEYKSGYPLGLYQMGACKIGVLIENDLYFPDAVKSLASCGCNILAVIMEEIKNNLPPMLIRSYAYLYGTPIVMCAGKMAYLADISGAIATSSQKRTLLDVTCRNSCRLVTTRLKGVSGDLRDDY